MADIFISYARGDKAAAERFAAGFEAEGLTVWWDTALQTGESFDLRIEEAIKSAKAAVVLWSEHSVKSRWVRAEATLADRLKKLLPVSISPCDLPIMFALTHTAELSHWQGDIRDPPWCAFLADIRAKLAEAGSTPAPPTLERPVPRPSSNLPLGQQELFGRTEDIARLGEAIAVHRLVTIAGPGGVGKSSAALAAASAVQAAFPDGVWWVELAPVADGATLPHAIARAIGLQAQAGLAELTEQIGQKRMLLVLDNCEHVIDAAAQACEAILRNATGIHILATSQERLRCPQEHLCRLAPLATPATDSERQGTDALDLFAARAGAMSPGFSLTSANLPTVAQICRQLDGLPLAIELAAARLPLLGLEGLRQRLEDRFRVLANASRHAPHRQRTLRGALEWSHGLLTPTEQVFFARLGAFVGWFDLDALEQVCSDDEIERWEVMDLTASLLDKSFLSVEQKERPRYRLLETPRAFALEQLARAPDARAVRMRHAGLMRQRLLEAQEAQWTSQASIVIDRVVQDISNLRAALHWAASADGDGDMLIALAGTGSVVWSQAGAEAEGLQWCEAALKAVTDTTLPELEAELLVAFAVLNHQNDAAREVAALERAISLFQSQHDRQGQFIALGALAKKNVWRRDLDGAERAIDCAQAIFDAAWPPAMQMNVLQAKTYLSELRGRPEEGEPFMLELLAILRALGDPEKIDLGMVELAESYMVQGRLEEAASLRQAVLDRADRKTPDTFNLANLSATYTQMHRLPEALACAREALDGLKRSTKANAFLDHLGLLACKCGRLAEGARLIGLSDAHYRASGFDREMSESRSRSQAEALLCAAFDDAHLAKLYAEGCAMTVADALEAALAQ